MNEIDGTQEPHHDTRRSARWIEIIDRDPFTGREHPVAIEVAHITTIADHGDVRLIYVVLPGALTLVYRTSQSYADIMALTEVLSS